jgi:hypothetical protein
MTAIIKWIIENSFGTIKNERQAKTVAICFAGLMIAIAIIIMSMDSYVNAGPAIKVPANGKVIYPTDGPPRLAEPFHPGH